MKKIAISLGIIGVVAAIVIGATTAYFSDTETSTGNLFKAGTIDIHVTGDNFTWSEGAVMEDMKPCYTDYINFTIYNDGSDPNPVNVWKKLILDEKNSGTGILSEPEAQEQCVAQQGNWDGEECSIGYEDNNDIASIINYDLSVTVYNSGNDRIWWQTIYAEEVTVDYIMGLNEGVYLGMIPVNGRMEVIQSYHMDDPDEPTNWAQGDIMDFDIEVKGVQLRGEAWLDNKEIPGTWKVITEFEDDIEGTLTYEVKHPKFDFSFDGKVLLPSTTYVLAAGMNPAAGGDNYDVDTYLGEGTSDGSGNISFSGDVELNKNMKDVKVWLLPKTKWNNGSIQWGQMDKWLWERGLIWYEDTDVTP